MLYKSSQNVNRNRVTRLGKFHTYYGQCFESYKSSSHFGATFPRLRFCIEFYKNGLGYILGDFSQNHLVTLKEADSVWSLRTKNKKRTKNVIASND
jgi:hypothetical protein